MALNIDLNTVLEGLAIVGILGIFNQLRLLNGSVAEMKQWQADHVKQDDERHAAVLRELERVQ